MSSTDRRTAIVTGAARGIGADVAKRLVAEDRQALAVSVGEQGVNAAVATATPRTSPSNA